MAWVRGFVSGGFGVVAALALAGACSSASGGGGSGAAGGVGGGAGDSSAGSGGSGGNDSGLIDSPSNDGSLNPDSACAQFTEEAKQAPAAMLIVLDRSLSMAQAGKWTAAQLAIVQAIDSSGFDNLALGLSVYPAGDVPGPACIFGFTVSCGVSALPQVPLSDSGTAKSNMPGVRQSIYNWLSANQPNGTATPGYDALKAAISALQLYSIQGNRLLLLISDGGFGCTSLSSPQRPAFQDSVGCLDWEHPDNVIKLLGAAYKDTGAPVRSFIVGVPGSDTKPTDQDAPPYYMRRALSAFALAGSPDTVPTGCDGNFTQAGTDPALPCHFDLTQGSFNAQSLSQSITDIRGKALGCVYQLPQPSGGGTVDKGKVNVTVTIDGKPTQIPKRTDATDTCATEPCWDYDKDDQIVLIGKACEDLKKSQNSKVEIIVGCTTIVK